MSDSVPAGSNPPEADRLEAEVWFRCADTAELWRFAQALPDPADGSDRIPPPEGRRNMVLTWDQPAEGEPWQATFDEGIGQATIVLEQAHAQGIDVHIYAIRVCPVDAEFQPQVDATAGFAAARVSTRDEMLSDDAFCDYLIDEIIVAMGGERGFTSDRFPFARWDMKRTLRLAVERRFGGGDDA